MWPPADHRIFKAMCGLAVLLSACLGHAASSSETALGRWLDSVAAAKLGTTLSNHPRFKGETIRIVAMDDGVPSAVSTELTETIAKALRRKLLGHAGVRIAWDAGSDREYANCRIVPPANYFLGIELAAVGGGRHRLDLAMVDVHEAVWVSGSSYTWEGRLSRSERRAATRESVQSDPGKAWDPLPIGRTDAVSSALTRNLSCTNPDGIEGTVYFKKSSDDPKIERVANAVDGKLAILPLVSFTTDEANASWHMSLVSKNTAEKAAELVLTLAPNDADPGNRARQQRLGSVYVTGLQTAKRAQLPRQPTPVADVPRAPVLSTLMAHLDCSPIDSCVGVEFGLRERAYVVAFHTLDARVEVSDCDAPTNTRSGKQDYEIRLPQGRSTDADIGFYALATEERGVAKALRAQLQKAPGACGARRRSSKAAMDSWLAGLERVMSEHEQSIQWRSLHLKKSTAGLARL